MQGVARGALELSRHPGPGAHQHAGDVGEQLSLHRALEPAAQRALDGVEDLTPQGLSGHRHLLPGETARQLSATGLRWPRGTTWTVQCDLALAVADPIRTREAGVMTATQQQTQGHDAQAGSSAPPALEPACGSDVREP